MFIPGGIVGAVGFILLLVAVGAAFYQSATLSAILMIVIAVVVIPLALMLVLPRLAMNAELKSDDGFVEGQDKHTMIGRVGKSLSPLRPVGTADFDGERVSVQTEHGMIESGEMVTVTKVEGNVIFVRGAEPEIG